MIDEKGRLFGKINIIDLFVLVVVVAVAAAVAYRLGPWSKASAPEAAQQQADGDVYVTVSSRLLPEEATRLLKVGDKLVAKGAFTNAEIVSVDITPCRWVAWSAEGVGVDTFHPFWKDITVVIKDKCSATAPIVRAGGQETRAGMTTFILKTQTFEAPATVLDVEFR